MTTIMRQEIDEIPTVAARLLLEKRNELRDAGTALRERNPAVVVTIARGSSDHAALDQETMATVARDWSPRA